MALTGLGLASPFFSSSFLPSSFLAPPKAESGLFLSDGARGFFLSEAVFGADERKGVAFLSPPKPEVAVFGPPNTLEAFPSSFFEVSADLAPRLGNLFFSSPPVESNFWNKAGEVPFFSPKVEPVLGCPKGEAFSFFSSGLEGNTEAGFFSPSLAAPPPKRGLGLAESPVAAPTVRLVFSPSGFLPNIEPPTGALSLPPKSEGAFLSSGFLSPNIPPDGLGANKPEVLDSPGFEPPNKVPDPLAGVWPKAGFSADFSSGLSPSAVAGLKVKIDKNYFEVSSVFLLNKELGPLDGLLPPNRFPPPDLESSVFDVPPKSVLASAGFEPSFAPPKLKPPEPDLSSFLAVPKREEEVFSPLLSAAAVNNPFFSVVPSEAGAGSLLPKSPPEEEAPSFFANKPVPEEEEAPAPNRPLGLSQSLPSSFLDPPKREDPPPVEDPKPPPKSPPEDVFGASAPSLAPSGLFPKRLPSLAGVFPNTIKLDESGQIVIFLS